MKQKTIKIVARGVGILIVASMLTMGLEVVEKVSEQNFSDTQTAIVKPGHLF
jgi:hypothetical protein